MSAAGTHNSEGINVDLYIPRKCSATNRLIEAKDKASIQVNIGHVNPDGVYTGEFTTMALCGFIRGMGEGDGARRTPSHVMHDGARERAARNFAWCKSFGAAACVKV